MLKVYWEEHCMVYGEQVEGGGGGGGWKVEGGGGGWKVEGGRWRVEG